MSALVIDHLPTDEILARITGDDGAEFDPLDVLADIEDLLQRLVEGIALLVVVLDTAQGGR